MFSSDNGIGGFHDDVLNAVPADDASSLKLIEEIKNRAKGSIASHNYRGAVTLYTKAIEICPSGSAGAKAILFSNRSLCHYSKNTCFCIVNSRVKVVHAIMTETSIRK